MRAAGAGPVKYSQVTAHMRRRGDAFLAGRLDDVLKDYVFPFPLDIQTTRVVVQTPQEARAILELQRTKLLQRGVFAMRPEVTALDMPTAGRFRIWVDWHEHAPLPESARLSSSLYYCRAQGSELKIEMIDCFRLSMPELRPELAALALSA